MASTAIPDTELPRLLELIKEADSVELKLTVPESHHASTIAALGLDPLEAQIRQVYFFDTPELVLFEQGVVVRARRIQGKGGDSVVKLRPVVPHELPLSLRQSDFFNVEVDAMPGGFVCSGSLKNTLGPRDVMIALAGQQPVRKLFSKEQRRFYKQHAPDDLGIDDLAVLGPLFVLKLRFTPEGLERRMVAEMWLYPDGSRVLELSTKCAPSEAFQVAAEVRGYLNGVGVDLSGEQSPKTRKALEFFANAPKAKAPVE
jgi:hypothetical protein